MQIRFDNITKMRTAKLFFILCLSLKCKYAVKQNNYKLKKLEMIFNIKYNKYKGR